MKLFSNKKHQITAMGGDPGIIAWEIRKAELSYLLRLFIKAAITVIIIGVAMLAFFILGN